MFYSTLKVLVEQDVSVQGLLFRKAHPSMLRNKVAITKDDGMKRQTKQSLSVHLP